MLVYEGAEGAGGSDVAVSDAILYEMECLSNGESLDDLIVAHHSLDGQ
jgi:hypothetical protein